MVGAEEVEDSADEKDIAVAEYTGGGGKPRILQVGEKQHGPSKGFDYDVNNAEQIFDLLLKEKQLKLLEGHKLPIV
jgi:hypothetical protein